jgi:hypothetical protein
MPWASDPLPWNVNFSKPPRLSGVYESLNYFPGNPILSRGRGAASLPNQILDFFPGGPVLCRGRGSASLTQQLVKLFPGGPVLSSPGMGVALANLKNSYNAPSVLSGGKATAFANLKYFPGGPVLQGSAAPIIAAKLLTHS